MVTKIGNAEVEVVGIRVTFGIRLPVDLVMQKESFYGCKEPEYRIVYAASGQESKGMSDADIGKKVRIDVFDAVKKFEALGKVTDREIEQT